MKKSFFLALFMFLGSFSCLYAYTIQVGVLGGISNTSIEDEFAGGLSASIHQGDGNIGFGLGGTKYFVANDRKNGVEVLEILYKYNSLTFGVFGGSGFDDGNEIFELNLDSAFFTYGGKLAYDAYLSKALSLGFEGRYTIAEKSSIDTSYFSGFASLRLWF